MDTLPTEIVELICIDGTLSRSDLCSISLTCKLYRSVSEPILYVHPHISLPRHIRTWSATMLAHPERGPLVKSLTLFPPPEFDFYKKSIFPSTGSASDDPNPDLTSKTIQIPSAISLCTNLVSLNIMDLSNYTGSDQNHFSLFFRHKEQSPFPKLKVFRNSFFTLKLLMDGYPIARFLDATPSITTLVLSPYGWQDLPHISNTMLPNLTTVSASVSVLRRLAASQEGILKLSLDPPNTPTPPSNLASPSTSVPKPRPITHIQVDTSVTGSHSIAEFVVYSVAYSDQYPLSRIISALPWFEETLKSLHITWDSETSYNGDQMLHHRALISLMELITSVTTKVNGLKYLRILDCGGRYSIRYLFAKAHSPFPELSASKLETLIIKPCQRLSHYPEQNDGSDSNSKLPSSHERLEEIFKSNVRASYAELQTHDSRLDAVRTFTSIFPALKTVAFDLWNGRVFEYSVLRSSGNAPPEYAVFWDAENIPPSKEDATGDLVRVVGRMVKEVDEEAWMYI